MSNLASNLDEIEESIEAYLTPREAHILESYILGTMNFSSSLDTLGPLLVRNKDYQDALQANLKRVGVNSVNVWRGSSSQSSKGNFLSVSLSENLANKIGKQIPNWTVKGYTISKVDIVGIGHVGEGELFVKRSALKEHMKKSELRQLIREEIRAAIVERAPTAIKQDLQNWLEFLVLSQKAKDQRAIIHAKREIEALEKELKFNRYGRTDVS